jgi:signal transduction histidine kinase
VRLNKLFAIIYAFIVLFLVVLVYVVVLMIENQRVLVESQNIRYQSYVIVNELKTSSDDLTRCCRTYVATGDSAWERQYWDVLAIRNGEKPRPDGSILSLQDSILKLGFTPLEIKELKKAEKNLNHLAQTENVAFHAMKGLYDDGTGHFKVKRKLDPDFAYRILFDKKYLEAKESFMRPIQNFLNMQQERTLSTQDKYSNRSYQLLGLSIVLILFIAILVIYSFFMMKDHILSKMNELKHAYAQIERSESEMRIKNEALDNEMEQVNIASHVISQNSLKIQELNETKDRFFSIIAHDLRAPLALLVSYSALIRRKMETKDYTDMDVCVENMYESSVNVNQLLNNLLTWANLQSTHVQTHPSPFSIVALIDSQIALYTKISAEKNILVKFRHEEDVLVNADKNQIELVIRNLISNAVKFTPKYGSVDISVERLPVDLQKVRITVSDTGVGLTTDQKRKLFNLSEKQSTRGTEGEVGTGLGLILCRDFLAKNNGTIAVESILGRGATFTVELPLN